MEAKEREEEGAAAQQEIRRGRWRLAEQMFKEAVNRALDKAAQDAKVSMALTRDCW